MHFHEVHFAFLQICASWPKGRYLVNILHNWCLLDIYYQIIKLSKNPHGPVTQLLEAPWHFSKKKLKWIKVELICKDHTIGMEMKEQGLESKQ